MSLRYFGTDGIRGKVGEPRLQPEFLRALGFAFGAFLQDRGAPRPMRIFVGRDTRESGPEMLRSVASGLAQDGVEILDGGVIPTPAIVHGIRHFEAAGGVAVTASHNPATDNGVKLFGPGGVKLTREEEQQIESRLDQALAAPGEPVPAPSLRPVEAFEAYRAFASRVLPAGALAGWIVAFDGANGAATAVNPEVLRQAGATVEVLGDGVGGVINDGVGSEFPDRVCRLTRDLGARIGITHDGDGDRVRFCDEAGSLLDGDETLGLLALDAHAQGRLPGGVAVFTVLSNMGLDAALGEKGVRVIRVGVGDRNVQHEMLRNGFAFGGESSGHIIPGDLTITGDGLLASLRMLDLLYRTRAPLSELRRRISLYPQIQDSIRVDRKVPIEELPGLRSAIGESERALEGAGRVLVRYSGTESKLRFLVEARDEAAVTAVLQRLRRAAEKDLAG